MLVTFHLHLLVELFFKVIELSDSLLDSIDFFLEIDETNDFDEDGEIIIHELLDAAIWISVRFANDLGLSTSDKRLEDSSFFCENVFKRILRTSDKDRWVGILSDVKGSELRSEL